MLRGGKVFGGGKMLEASNLVRERLLGIKAGGIIHVVDDPEDALPSGCGAGKVPPAVEAGEC